jgi:hypothetical protein
MVARQTSQQGNPSCLVSKAATATSLSRTGTAPSPRRQLLLGTDTEMRGERQEGAMLAQAGLPSKTAETNVDKA